MRYKKDKKCHPKKCRNSPGLPAPFSTTHVKPVTSWISAMINNCRKCVCAVSLQWLIPTLSITYVYSHWISQSEYLKYHALNG